MPVLKYRPNLSFLIILLLGVLYITLPSVNNSLDSLAYAEEIRSGSYLFRPHHLLYNAFGYALAHSLNIKNTLSLMHRYPFIVWPAVLVRLPCYI